jgi:hypothetical protein
MKTLLFLLLATAAFSKDYFVTQSGSTTAMSVAAYNTNAAFTGGDTVFFSGTITTPIGMPKSGTTTAQLILDGTAAKLVPVSGNPAISFGGKSYVTVRGFTIVPPTPASWPKNALIRFNAGSESTGCVIENVSASGDLLNGTDLLTDLRWTSFITIQNCTIKGLASIGWFDGPSHDLLIRGNYFESSANQSVQTDIFSYGDGYNILIEFNKFINRAPGATVGRHNDVIQCYHSGANGGTFPDPYNLTIRYNWIETAGMSGSGDMSWLMLENLNGSAPKFSAKIYGNVFFAPVGAVANNGAAISGDGGDFFVYNNTLISSNGSPGNTFYCRATNGTLYNRNNIGYDATRNTGVVLNWSMKTGAQWNYNFFRGWDVPSAVYPGPNGSSNLDPLFVDQANRNYALATNSPLLGAGDSTLGGEYYKGLAPGAVWPNPLLVDRGNKWDVGAFQSSGIIPPPIIVPPSNAKITTSVSTISADGKSITTVITFDKSLNP